VGQLRRQGRQPLNCGRHGGRELECLPRVDYGAGRIVERTHRGGALCCGSVFCLEGASHQLCGACCPCAGAAGSVRAGPRHTGARDLAGAIRSGPSALRVPVWPAAGCLSSASASGQRGPGLAIRVCGLSICPTVPRSPLLHDASSSRKPAVPALWPLPSTNGLAC
jgi:hypothetical protein